MGDSSNKNDQNDQTQLLSESQVLEVKPSPSKVADHNDRSVWKGVVVGADEFTLPAPPRSSGPSWLVLAILTVGVLGGGAYLAWTMRRAPAVGGRDAARPVAGDAPTEVAIDAPPADAPVDRGAAMADAPADAMAATPVDAMAAAPVDAGVAPIKHRPRPKHPVEHKVR